MVNTKEGDSALTVQVPQLLSQQWLNQMFTMKMSHEIRDEITR